MATTTFLSIFTILIFPLFAKGQLLLPVVQTNSGKVAGQYMKTVLGNMTYKSFRGIPYAEPPLGELRFRPPKPKKPWNGTFLALKDGPTCIQQDRKNNNIVLGSEDCLYLNVYVPVIRSQSKRGQKQKQEKKKPVIVWIHGGAFTTGNGKSTFYGPDFLIETNVIVVSIQYRLGPFGFLNINHPQATGNCGLKDQNEGLKWVQQNIENFGGDRKKVTILGQSAGGVSVDLQVLSSMSTGLFRQSISMSASPLCIYWAFQSNAEAEERAFQLGKRLNPGLDNNKDNLLAILKNAPASKIIEQASQLGLIPFRPTLEDSRIAPEEPKFLTECTPKKYKQGNYNKGPHMMGFTLNEILFLANSPDELINYTLLAPKIINTVIPLSAIPAMMTIVSFPAKSLAKVEKIVFMNLINELSNLYFVTGIDRKQKLMSETNQNPIYYYRYSFHSPYSAHKFEGIENLDGVAHEDELSHLFYRPQYNIPLDDQRISLMRRRLVKMWSNFAKYGNPTPDGPEDSLLQVTWPDSRKSGLHLEINDKLEVGD
ncbi:venom carboxylesterase-6-like, partial [Copidosoma floridanum]|uniref:venom carboxylesterase-6-like n=1 Tax=Copidosoma floridanum TaxID=29053 RepID=UPI0006C98379